MARFTFNVSQMVRYNVYVEAPTRMDALRKLIRELQEPDGKPIDLYEIDSDGLTIDISQMDISDDEINDDLPVRRGRRKQDAT
jgi:hypothetical protein